jgi:hypothetical protein
MTGPEHYQLAETALEAAAATQGETLHYTAAEALLDAVAHAVLALAAATVDGPALMRPEDRDEWDRATGRGETVPSSRETAEGITGMYWDNLSSGGTQ